MVSNSDSFHGIIEASKVEVWNKKTKITYNFYNHFHPYTGELIEQLNKKSLAGLFDIGFQNDLVLDFFNDDYGPNITNTLDVTYQPKTLDLDVHGPYSVYNWELFFHAPITIAVHLSKNQRFAEAQKWFHYIFDPTSNDVTVSPPMRFWKFLKFRENTPIELINDILTHLSTLVDDGQNKQTRTSIEGWREKPFHPHVIAQTRVVAYQFHVVMKYLDNLIAWGDSLFLQDTIEAINESTQIYILAANILGPKPQETPRFGKTKPETYNSLKGRLDAFGNALVDMEGLFPFNLIPSTTPSNTQTNSLFGIARTLYFCIPQNGNLLGYWYTVADRLFKIRHCMNIEGVVRQLPLFEAPIDPGMLVKAIAAGINISSMVSGLNQPLSLVRALMIIQKALEICSEVKTLGSALLSALEKKDAEGMALLRQEHEITILHLVEDVKYLQWKETEAATDALLKTREVTYQRYRHYQLLLGKSDNDLKDIKDLSIVKKELNKDNFDEVYTELIGNYGKPIKLEEYRKEEQTHGGFMEQTALFAAGALGSGDGANLQLNSGEGKELNTFMPAAHSLQQHAAAAEVIGAALSLIPQFEVAGEPIGVGGAIGFGGQQLSTFASIHAKIIRFGADELNYSANRASKLASYQRRIDDWVLQNNLATSELVQIGRQIISSLIREQIVKKEYENHKKQIDQAQEIDDFLKNKFTNQDLYTWMQGEISRVYHDCYKFAFDVAKKAEQTMKYELMSKELDGMSFIKFNYWDSGKKGLLSGEALYLDLKRMEMAYHDYNKREYELTMHVSLQQLDSKALLKLKATGSCEITIPEWLFDMYCPGHYMRRIKTVSLSIPCVVGPYASINCTLSLLKSTIRKSPLLGDGYERNGNEDDRFKDYFGAIPSIVTSNAQNDSGLFETNLKDERYLTFENAGVESTWRLELPNDFKQFDYNTISDVILHLRYTARNGGTELKSNAIASVQTVVADAINSGLARSFSLNHDFPTEWHQFVTSTGNLKIVIKKEHFPYIAQGFTIIIKKIELFTITDGELIPRNVDRVIVDTVDTSVTPPGTTHVSTTVDETYLGILSGDINNNGESEIIIPQNTDDKVLIRDKDQQVFLALSYILEPKT